MRKKPPTSARMCEVPCCDEEGVVNNGEDVRGPLLRQRQWRTQWGVPSPNICSTMSWTLQIPTPWHENPGSGGAWLYQIDLWISRSFTRRKLVELPLRYNKLFRTLGQTSQGDPSLQLAQQQQDATPARHHVRRSCPPWPPTARITWARC
jgi:hypothetical protein